ncbi:MULTISPECIES: hypothetical protein [unclassified Micromonospora]|uniref:hypothetical protein n=1 Tax=unclassified Micromonospora TaxID=2617518 RepID=UPI001F0F6DA3|nr:MULTISPECIES: hypothetical protein [unclassified Micromonospora]
MRSVHPERLMTLTTTYSGPARLILSGGARISGMASLSTNQRGGLNGWGGTFRPDEITTDLRNAVEGLQLELPYDRVGTVAVTGLRKLLATQVLMSLAGRGPAPF